MTPGGPVLIGGRPVGAGHPPFIIAELSGNHNGDPARALALVDAAAAAGADAVKLQTYTADTLTLDADTPYFRIEAGPWAGRTLHALYREAATPWDWHAALFARARAHGLLCFSTPFDPTAVAFLRTFDPPAHKIASFELVDLPLISLVAQEGRPIIMSTGMASLAEIMDAVAAARAGGCRDLVLLHCVSGYPSDPADSNLAAIADLAARTGAVAGLSDHTLGTAVAVTAAALGASVIEKHLTLSRADGGPDAGFSLEPAEFAELVAACRTAWSAIGRVTYERKPSEATSLAFRRSLFVVSDMAAGETFTAATVRSIRPAAGLGPRHLPDILGRRAASSIVRGTPLSWELVAPQADAVRRTPGD